MLTAADSELLNGKPTSWWFVVHVGGRNFAHGLFLVGVVALCVAWVGLGRWLRAERASGAARTLTVPRLLGIGALWSLPLFVGPELFSGDMYSYLAQGELLHLGIDPYQHAPAALAATHPAVFHAVSPFWRHTTAPYGPLFVGLAAVIAGLVGPHLVLGVILLRVLELGGLALLAWFVPRLATALGADPAWATWLAVISPLATLELVAAGHNDALMAGLLLAGVYYAVIRRPLLAITICTAAAAVKPPAGAAVLLIAICWLRGPSENDPFGVSENSLTRILGRVGRAHVVRVLVQTVVVVVAIFAVLGVATGVDLHWLSGNLLSVPGRVKLAITPATAIGFSVHSLLHGWGVIGGGSARPLESALGTVTLFLTVGLAIVLCQRVSYERLVPYLAALLLALVIGGPAAWPWYLTWGVALLATCRPGQRPPMLAGVAGLALVAVFVVWPNGNLRFPLTQAPYVLAVYAAALVAIGVWLTRSHGGLRLRRAGAAR